MLECSSMFEAHRKQPKQFPVLGKHGVVQIRFNGRLDSVQISKMLSDIHFILSVYKRGCKKICFVCNGVFEPKDMFVYVLFETSVYKGYKQDKIEMRGDRAEMSDFPLYLNTVAGGLDRRDQTIGGFSFVVKIYAVPVVEIIG